MKHTIYNVCCKLVSIKTTKKGFCDVLFQNGRELFTQQNLLEEKHPGPALIWRLLLMRGTLVITS